MSLYAMLQGLHAPREEEDDAAGGGGGGAPDNQDSPPEDDAAGGAQAGGRRGNVVTLASSAISRIRQEERQRGERRALARLDEEARKLGFKSHAALVEAAGRRRAGTRQAVPDDDGDEDSARHARSGRNPGRAGRDDAGRRREGAAPDPREDHQLRRTVADLQHKLAEEQRRARRLAARASTETKTRKRLARLSAAKEAELELRMAAVRAGISDVDYAVAQVQKHTRTLKDSELAAFDEHKFFLSMKKTQPYLFRAANVPAGDGDPAGSAPPKGNNGTGVGEGNAPKDEPADARLMSQADYQTTLKKLGYTNPAGGMPV